MSEMFVSTEDPNMAAVDFRTALVDGSAPNGALYAPNRFTTLDLESLKDMLYPQLHVAVHGTFVGDSITVSDQNRLANGAYSPDKFTIVDDKYIGALKELYPNIYHKDLSTGETYSFKDNAMVMIGELTEHFLLELGEKRVIVGATSGDTGSSAENAMKGRESVVSFILSPEEGPSDTQKGQMGILSDGETIFNIAIDGDFTDCQNIVLELNELFDNLGAVNSINFGRVASQVAYYFSTYFQTIEKSGGQIGDEINFVVPSGNAGNVLAGFIAKKMGLPINKLIVATNENNTLHNIIQTGTYEEAEFVERTHSPSMNIRLPNNYMRILFHLADQDQKTVTDYKKLFKQNGKVSFSDIGMDNSAMKIAGFESDTCSDPDTLSTIAQVYCDSGYIIDPHAATGVYAALRYTAEHGNDIPTVVLGTAHPAKFPESMKLALPGVDLGIPDDLKRAAEWGGKIGYEHMPKDTIQVSRFILSNISDEFKQSMMKG